MEEEQAEMAKLSDEQKRWIGSRVRRARKSRDWSQARLAEEAGVNDATVRRVEHGAENVRPGSLRAVLDALEITDLLEQVSGDVNPAEKMAEGLTGLARSLGTIEDPAEQMRAVQALDIVAKWLTAIEDPAERLRAVQELTAWVVLRDDYSMR